MTPANAIGIDRSAITRWLASSAIWRPSRSVSFSPGFARRAASIIREGTYVNLGVGIPAMVSNYVQERDVILHAENGLLGYGGMVSLAQMTVAGMADPARFRRGKAYVAEHSVSRLEISPGALAATVAGKWAGHGITAVDFTRPTRSMSEIGG